MGSIEYRVREGFRRGVFVALFVFGAVLLIWLVAHMWRPEAAAAETLSPVNAAVSSATGAQTSAATSTSSAPAVTTPSTSPLNAVTNTITTLAAAPTTTATPATHDHDRHDRTRQHASDDGRTRRHDHRTRDSAGGH